MLENISCPKDLENFSNSDLHLLAKEVRQRILDTASKNGGHVASNLGVVELTIALHKVFNNEDDAIIFDVSHQSYTHKLLTGRNKEFETLRKQGGISGFTKRKESPYDYFDAGHASTSISSALGLLTGRKLLEKSGKVVAVIGDGALTGGMAFEALSHGGQLSKDLIVVLNDNQMSISRNTGSLSRYLSRLTSTARYQSFRNTIDKTVQKIPFLNKPLSRFIFRFKRAIKASLFSNNLFVDLGFEYFGPFDGHNIESLSSIFNDVKKSDRPCVVHVLTKKGYKAYLTFLSHVRPKFFVMENVKGMANKIEEIKENFDRLLSVVQETAKSRTGRMKGEIHSALVEEINEHDSSLVTGRLSNNTIVHFPGDESLIGKIVDVKLIEAHGFYYIGEICN